MASVPNLRSPPSCRSQRHQGCVAWVHPWDKVVVAAALACRPHGRQVVLGVLQEGPILHALEHHSLNAGRWTVLQEGPVLHAIQYNSLNAGRWTVLQGGPVLHALQHHALTAECRIEQDVLKAAHWTPNRWKQCAPPPCAPPSLLRVLMPPAAAAPGGA